MTSSTVGDEQEATGGKSGLPQRVDNSLNPLFAVGIFQLMLPNQDNLPAIYTKMPNVSLIPGSIRVKFVPPEFRELMFPTGQRLQSSIDY